LRTTRTPAGLSTPSLHDALPILTRNMRELAKLAPASSAAALADSNRSSLSRIGTAIAFFATGVRHDTSPTPGAGASRTGVDRIRALAFAIAAACRAAPATASGSSRLVAAKPQA